MNLYPQGSQGVSQHPEALPNITYCPFVAQVGHLTPDIRYYTSVTLYPLNTISSPFYWKTSEDIMK